MKSYDKITQQYQQTNGLVKVRVKDEVGELRTRFITHAEVKKLEKRIGKESVVR